MRSRIRWNVGAHESYRRPDLSLVRARDACRGGGGELVECVLVVGADAGGLVGCRGPVALGAGDGGSLGLAGAGASFRPWPAAIRECGDVRNIHHARRHELSSVTRRAGLWRSRSWQPSLPGTWPRLPRSRPRRARALLVPPGGRRSGSWPAGRCPRLW
jgi:hypothetical protein